jgi:putative oxidoreductase
MLSGILGPSIQPQVSCQSEVQGIMNFRNRYLVIAIRTLLGLIMLASGMSGLLMGNSTKGVPAQMVTFTQVFWASGIFQMVKVTELVAGFMLLVGILPALATLFLAPDVVGIVVVNARLIPSFLWIGAIVFVLTAYLGYAYWDKYKSIFSRN